MTADEKKEYMKNWRKANKEKIKDSYNKWVIYEGNLNRTKK